MAPTTEEKQWKSAKVVEYLEVPNPNDGSPCKFVKNDFCLIRHLGLHAKEENNIIMDDYWKGLILQIRKTTKNKYLAKVSWMYTAKQLLERSDVKADTKRYINTFGKQELCGSDSTDIIDAQALEDTIDIVIIKNQIEDQPPVTAYYMRYFWDGHRQALKGEPEICGATHCYSLWSPDTEEQRYCWSCKRWSHLTCLGTPANITQQQYLNNLYAIEKFADTPKIILQVAFQPTARGGLTYFTAGNIRIVNKARKLLSSQERSVVQASGWIAAHLIEESRLNMIDTDWENWLEAEFGIDNTDSYEPLVVTDQTYYTCPRSYLIPTILHRVTAKNSAIMFPSTIKQSATDLMDGILKAKRIVVLCGAGISVAAGIPCFRGPDGLYTGNALSGFTGVNLTDLLTSSSLVTQKQQSLHCQLIATLAEKAAIAQPTAFHHFLRALDLQGVLLRVYTQNIDGLELKAGLHMSSEIHPSDGPARCIPLHGSLEELRCPGCSSIFILEPYYPSLKEGQLPECTECQINMEKRVEQGKRRTTVPRLRPNIILYGEPHPRGEEIANVQQNDLGLTTTPSRQLDLLLVVGTSLKVKGTTDFIKQSARILAKNSPKSSLQASPQVIYLNNTFTNTATWAGIFDAWIDMDCEEFARLALKRMEEMIASGEMLESNHTQVQVLYGDRKLNYRPSWRLWS